MSTRSLFPAALFLSVSLVLSSIAPAAAQTPAAPASAVEACARFDRAEADGKAQVARRIAAIDAAADSGDVDGFCAATGDLVFVYRSMRDQAAACSPERATRWADASARTETALAGTCR